MKTPEKQLTSERKKDHIDLAFQSRITHEELDSRFYYEPVLSGHPQNDLEAFSFLGKNYQTPMWVSSMTGGTEIAGSINRNLAMACKKYGFGMGLGSCRIILDDDTYLDDFRMRPFLGDEVPFYANLGIAQIEELLENNRVSAIEDLVKRLDADGLIVHINPLQEWLQPEGDRIRYAPLTTILQLLEKTDLPLIVKEVGQGMGPESLRALLQLPLEAVEFAANGGTNFAKLELLRASQENRDLWSDIPTLGHSAEEMVRFTNRITEELGDGVLCRQVIISGGVKNYLDGYYLRKLSALPAVYGQASEFLKRAQHSFEELDFYIEQQIKGLRLAEAFLKIRP